jgi:lysozyme family protein
MPSRFEICLSRILKHEGGRVDDVTDRGGRTNQGVTQRVYDAYRTKHGRPVKDVWEIEQPELRDIYLANYWVPVCCSQLPVGLDYVVFDMAVNSGPRQAGRLLQRSLGMDSGDVDGVIGNQTLKYVNDVMAANEVAQTITRFTQFRMEFLDGIVKRDPSQSRFIKGWARRCNDVLDCALEERG